VKLDVDVKRRFFDDRILQDLFEQGCMHEDFIDQYIECDRKTPLVEISKLNPNKKVKVFAKLESFNPGGSIKDRVALYMIEGAERRGELTKDKIILEATSGNTGIGLALIAAAKGYRLCLAMSEAASEERKKILKAMVRNYILHRRV